MAHHVNVLAGVALLALSIAGSASAAETAVDQRDLTFIPDSVTINAGDSVRFTNSDRIAHDVTVDNPDGTSEDKGMDAYQHGILVTFSKTGVYHVRCKIHPAMRMTITVK